MSHGDPVRIFHVGTRPSLLSTIRDVAIILVCAALLLGTAADALLGSRPSVRPAPTPAVSSAAEPLPM